MEKRVTFRGWLLPLVLIAPQVMISAIFFFTQPDRLFGNRCLYPIRLASLLALLGLEISNFLSAINIIAHLLSPQPCSLCWSRSVR